MNVYAIEGSGNYGGGMAVIAAKSANEAIEIASHIKSYCNVDYKHCDCIEKLPVQYGGKSKVLTNFELCE